MKRKPNLEFVPLVSALAISCAIAVFSIRDWTTYQRWQEAARRHDLFVRNATALLADVRDAETGQRGYLLTGKDSYLEPYRASRARISADLSALFASANEAQAPRVGVLKTLTEQKLAELQLTIELRGRNGMAAALEVVETDRGKRYMDEIRDNVAALLKDAENTGRVEQDRLHASAAVLRWVSVFGSLTLAALLLAAQLALGTANAKRLNLIDELRQSRDDVAASRDLFQTTLRSIGDGVIATDLEGRVTFLNPVARHLTGWTQESAVGLPLGNVFRTVNEGTRKTIENPVEKVIRTGHIVGFANHTILVARDGRELPIDDSAAPIRNAAGDMIGTVLVFRDNTERRRAEVEMRRSQAELELSNEALQQLNSDLELFAYAAGHDLQEPLRTISAFSELVARRLDGNADVKQYLSLIQTASGRMRDMIDGLLRYSQLMLGGELERSQVHVQEVLGEVLLNCQSAITESEAVIHAGPMPVVWANRQQLVQLLQNLVSNAIKYRSEKKPEIEISASEVNGGGWLFSVRDNGTGFEMSYAEQIFKIFRRLDSSDRGGTGLGLAMCKRIVELHGGRIWVESEPGCGSIFRFTVEKNSST